MKLDLGNHWKGQFFTPYSITKMMAKVTIGNFEQQISEKGYVSVNDCACGAGATLIAAAEEAYTQLNDTKYNWQNHILFFAQDIDAVTAKMCYIQLSLLGCAGAVKIGDSLSEPMCSGESDENIGTHLCGFLICGITDGRGVQWIRGLLLQMSERHCQIPLKSKNIQKMKMDSWHCFETTLLSKRTVETCKAWDKRTFPIY